MIHGYPANASVVAGEDLVVHVSTDAPEFRVDLYRQGQALTPVTRSGWLPGRSGSVLPPDAACRWPPHRLAVPAGSRSGAHVAVLVEGDGRGGHRGVPSDMGRPDGPGRLLVAVRTATPGRDAAILYKLPVFTYHAYNAWGGRTWYLGGPDAVSLHRPGGGLGGLSNYPGWAGFDEDPLDPGSRRQTFAHWDAPFIAWLEANGYCADYCTDIDVHREPALLAPYRLLVSAGHDEYWTQEMRDHVRSFLDGGGNVAVFGGNTCFRKVALDGGPGEPARLTRLGEWWRLGDPENSLTGVGFRGGGAFWWGGARPQMGYVVEHAGHWAFDGIARSADPRPVIGADHGLIGYEVDGAHFERANGGAAMAVGDDATPVCTRDSGRFVILATAVLGATRPAELGPGPWWTFEDKETQGDHAATMGLYVAAGGGICFNAATTDWPRVAALDPDVATVTRNVLDHLERGGVRVVATPAQPRTFPFFVEGEVARFEALAPPAAAQGRLRHRWTTSIGSEPAEGPAIEIRLPAGTAPVTVAVEVDDDAGPAGFGTVTVYPQASRRGTELNLVCVLRDVAAAIEGSRRAQERPYGVLRDPGWDPLRHTGLADIGAEALGRLADDLRRAAELAAELAR